MREFREVSIELIDESDNIRRSFSEEKLQELAASIREHGVLKPLLVRPNAERFLLIDGWRQLTAAKQAKCRTISVRVRDIDDNAAEEEMIIADLHHEDVTPLDEATELVGRPSGLPTRRYPQAIVVALALRYSWRRDNLIKLAKRLGVKLTAKDLREAEAANETEASDVVEADAIDQPEAVH